MREKAELHRKELLAGQTEFLGEWKERLRDLADRQEVAEDFKERFLERYDALTSRYTEFRISGAQCQKASEGLPQSEQPCGPDPETGREARQKGEE